MLLGDFKELDVSIYSNQAIYWLSKVGGILQLPTQHWEVQIVVSNHYGVDIGEWCWSQPYH